MNRAGEKPPSKRGAGKGVKNMKVNSETICAYSKKPLCPKCKGAVYECDPFKNTPCRKTFCGECGYTTQIEYAKNVRPLCPRNLLIEAKSLL